MYITFLTHLTGTDLAFLMTSGEVFTSQNSTLYFKKKISELVALVSLIYADALRRNFILALVSDRYLLKHWY
jgi:hypothetical protein